MGSLQGTGNLISGAEQDFPWKLCPRMLHSHRPPCDGRRAQGQSLLACKLAADQTLLRASLQAKGCVLARESPGVLQ